MVRPPQNKSSGCWNKPELFGGLNALIIAGLGDFITLDEVTDVLKTRLLANPLVKIRQIFEVHPSQFHT